MSDKKPKTTKWLKTLNYISHSCKVSISLVWSFMASGTFYQLSLFPSWHSTLSLGCKPYSYWVRWWHLHYRKQDGERDEAENRRYLQCPVSMISRYFHVNPWDRWPWVALRKARKYGHVSILFQILPTMEEREKRYWEVGSLLVWLMISKGKTKEHLPLYLSTKEVFYISVRDPGS